MVWVDSLPVSMPALPVKLSKIDLEVSGRHYMAMLRYWQYWQDHGIEMESTCAWCLLPLTGSPSNHSSARLTLTTAGLLAAPSTSASGPFHLPQSLTPRAASTRATDSASTSASTSASSSLLPCTTGTSPSVLVRRMELLGGQTSAIAAIG